MKIKTTSLPPCRATIDELFSAMGMSRPDLKVEMAADIDSDCPGSSCCSIDLFALGIQRVSRVLTIAGPDPEAGVTAEMKTSLEDNQ